MTTEKVVCPEGWWPTLLLSNTVTPLNGCPLAPSLPPRSPKHQVFLHPHLQTLPPLPDLTYYCLQTLLPSLELAAASKDCCSRRTSRPTIHNLTACLQGIDQNQSHELPVSIFRPQRRF